MSCCRIYIDAPGRERCCTPPTWSARKIVVISNAMLRFINISTLIYKSFVNKENWWHWIIFFKEKGSILICGEQTLDALCFMSTKKKARIDDEPPGRLLFIILSITSREGSRVWLAQRTRRNRLAYIEKLLWDHAINFGDPYIVFRRKSETAKKEEITKMAASTWIQSSYGLHALERFYPFIKFIYTSCYSPILWIINNISFMYYILIFIHDI